MPTAFLAAPIRAVIAAPFGALTIYVNEAGVVKIDLAPGSAELVAPSTPLLEEACRQFNAYFQNPLQPFSLPLVTRGTDYSQRVWRALCEIPPGQVKSYGRLARELASGAQAVASACRANELPIVIPCHRVVAGNSLGGYCGQRSGPFLDIKRWLLRHEGYDLA
jgi:methylated-DNA-[protein]-cysteine S-methyltransferase